MKRLLLLILAFGVAYSLQAQDCLNLIWEDDVNGTALDLTKWNYDIGNGCPELCGWGNNEQQWYAQNNVSVGNGLLTITAKEEAMGGLDYTSGFKTFPMSNTYNGRLLWPPFQL